MAVIVLQTGKRTMLLSMESETGWYDLSFPHQPWHPDCRAFWVWHIARPCWRRQYGEPG